MALLVGDLKAAAYKRTRSRPSLEDATLLCKTEHVYGKRLFCTRATLADGEKEYDIIIETSLSAPGDPEMWISIGSATMTRVTNLNWRFRGNETVMVNTSPVQILWDVHNWLHSNPGSGPGLFIFKPGMLECVSDSDSDGRNGSKRNGGGIINDPASGEGSPLTTEFCFFLYAWRTEVKKNNATAITCLQRRDGSSVPVRYIPKISSKTDRPETPLPVKDSEKNEFRNVLVECILVETASEKKSTNAYSFSSKTDKPETPLPVKAFVDYELMEEPEDIAEEFCIHQEDDLKEDVSCAVKTKQEADKLAIELLAMRAFTAVEMRKKLQGKRFSPDIVEAVVDDFQSRGFINDGLYAETFSRSRWSSSSWGPRRIKQALLKKGVSEVAAENAIKLVFEGDESGAQASSSLGLSKLSMDHLFIQASKQWLRGQDVPRETRKSRIIRWLQYRGFNWDVVSVILKKLESHHAP
ncbi:Regulatory protein RecX [Morella rubra]|uniref:Regulatory protein RecX n=1 Tax=Morella rubra TaxID=262757 RepID=A0A6A1VQ41_9ROSI|nr:Regulatory protein RecX [Morella rubra]